MNVVNHTPFPAQVFDAIDQYEQEFRVFVLRQTLDFSSGQLEYADTQAPLCDIDEYFGEDYAGSPRQESDYCPFKPKCDVIVNATAYAPAGKALTKFPVGLIVSRDGTRLIEKTLVVCGERFFQKHSAFVRLFQWCLKWGTLSLVRLNPWKLTSAAVFTSLPLRAEYSYGGQCRVEQEDRASKRVPKRYRLTPEQLAEHPDTQASDKKPPAAHVSFDANAAGIGFATDWYLKATRCSRVLAPRIEHPDAKLTAKQFWRTQKSENKKASKLDSAGFGIRSKLHPDRLSFVGEVDDAFVNSSAPLPHGFDFEIWNAAPVDQQIELLAGGDVVELLNLCSLDTPNLLSTDRGHRSLSLVLPEHECFIRLRGDGMNAYKSLLVDTVLIEPDSHALTLVWRLAIPKHDCDDVALSEFRMRDFSERDRARSHIQGPLQPPAESHEAPDCVGVI